MGAKITTAVKRVSRFARASTPSLFPAYTDRLTGEDALRKLPTMDAVQELADPDELLVAEDFVILVMRDSWTEPPGGGIPDGLRLDATRRTLTMSQRGLSVNCSLFGENNIATAVFAGCDALETCAPFRLTAKHVLKGTDTLLIVHNKDKIYNLVHWFPSVKRLLLPHNIRLQFDEELRLHILDYESDLEELLGSTPAMGSSDLYINRNALAALLLTCPKLRRLQASLHGDLVHGELHFVFPTLLGHMELRLTPELRLGCYLERSDGSAFVMDGVSPDSVTLSSRLFPEVTYLEVTMKSAEVVPCIGKFTLLTTLVVAFSFTGVLLDFAPGMESVLGELPRLEELSLNYFRDVDVATIARKCPRIRRLSLMHCSLPSEEIADNIWDASPPRSLDFLRLNISTLPSVVSSLIISCCRQIKELRLDDLAACVLFFRCAMKTAFDALERLTLCTDATAADLLLEEEYATVVNALPALRHLTTDSYDLRLLFSHLSSTRKVALAWCTCIMCAAEFPRVDRAQLKLWCTLQNQPAKSPRINSPDAAFVPANPIASTGTELRHAVACEWPVSTSCEELD